MLLFYTFTLTLWLCVSLAPWTAAWSTRPLPLKRYTHVSDIQLDRLDKGHAAQKRHPNHLAHSDAFRLSFRAFERNFHLHLEPTENLIPAAGAQVRYTSHDPDTGEDVLQRQETLFPHDIRAYQGHVIHSDYTARRLAEDRIGLRRDLMKSETDVGIMGAATILLVDDGSQSGRPSFQGTFSWAGNEHTIQSPHQYHTSRTPHDPVLEKRAWDMGGMVIHRRSDVMSEEEASVLGIRSDVSASGCTADLHHFNRDHALHFTGSEPVSAMSFFAARPQRTPNRFSRSFTHYSYEAALDKRQGDALGGTNNDSFVQEIGSKKGCPSSSQALYMGIASDCTYTARFGNESDARLAILNNMNTVSNIYRTTFRVSLGVVQMEIRDGDNCPTSATGNVRWNQACSENYQLDQRLSDFSSWRASNPANGTGLWHLLTACSTGTEVGVAWLGTLCKTDETSSNGNVVSGTGVSAVTQREAQVMAHEIGHNFGAVHDCVSGCSISGSTARQSGGQAVCCPESQGSCDTSGKYIMSPVSETDTEEFSPCSVGNICSMIGRGLDTSCIEDPSQSPRETLSVQQCGNGIVEPGEECDAGPNGSDCCNKQCQLTSGSLCDPESSSCCTDNCQFAPSSTVCRPAVDDRCDTTESCTGTSAECPKDERKKDGDSCGSDGLTCASGHCSSRDLQCQQQSQADYNFSRACSLTADNSCRVSCENPSQTGSCLVLQQQFIDGTECGYGGRCQGGECKSGSWQSVFNSWYRNNLRISIPVTIVIGVVILLALYALLRCLCLPLIGRCTGRKVPGAVGPAVPGRRARHNKNTTHSTQYGLPPPPPHPSSFRGAHSTDPLVPSYDPPQAPPQSRWVDPYSYNGRVRN